MNWKELIETKKTQLIVVFLLVLVLLCAVCVRSCTNLDRFRYDENESLPEGAYLAMVTYVVNFPDTNEEPIVFVQQVAPNGKALIIPEIVDTDDTIWSGWFTEEGAPFDFNTVLRKDTTIHCFYYNDKNNNNIADGTGADPITVYRFLNINKTVMVEETFFGLDAEFDYTADAYAFPQGENDGYVFLGWKAQKSVSKDNGIMTVNLTPELASDRNNNDLVDGTAEDPYSYHVFLDQNGELIQQIRRLAGEDPVNTEGIACPTTSKQKLVGWNCEESVNEAGETVYTYTPQIEEQE